MTKLYASVQLKACRLLILFSILKRSTKNSSNVQTVSSQQL